MQTWNWKLCFRYGCLIAVVSLTGCAEFKQWMHNGKVGPEYRKPVAPVAYEWIDFNDPRVISQQNSVNGGAWWQSLNDPVLDQLVAQSYDQNLSLRAAGMRVMEARAQRGVAAGLLLPQFQEAFGSYDRIQVSSKGNSVGLPALPVRAFDFWSTGWNVGWELDVWGRFRRNLESAEANLDASIEDYDDILVCLVAETAAAYVEMREFEQRLAYARENVKTQQGSLELAESRFRNGRTSELDVTQAKSNLAQTEALVPVLKKGLRLANNRLCVLLGTPPRDLQPEIGPAPIPAAPAEVIVGIPAELLRRRPDIRRAERQVAVQSAQIGVAAADLFPAFTINGSLGWQAKNFSDLFSSAANVGFVGPAFNWNILHYGRIRNNILAQDAKFQELAILYQETVLKANAEVEDAIVGFLQAQEQVQALREGVEASGRSVELALRQYREGTTDFNRVFNLQSILVSQQDELAAAQADVTLSLVRIYKALGGGWRIRFGQGAPYELVAPEQSVQPEPVEVLSSDAEAVDIPAPTPAIEDGAQYQ
jgi:NodT family efflux transporter outer membrane factor (OMF) lipoprotein